MQSLDFYVGKKVVIIDTNNKKWTGFVESYNDDDDFGDYQGESIDVVTTDILKNVCFGKTDIKSIKVI